MVYQVRSLEIKAKFTSRARKASIKIYLRLGCQRSKETASYIISKNSDSLQARTMNLRVRLWMATTQMRPHRKLTRMWLLSGSSTMVQLRAAPEEQAYHHSVISIIDRLRTYKEIAKHLGPPALRSPCLSHKHQKPQPKGRCQVAITSCSCHHTSNSTSKQLKDLNRERDKSSKCSTINI